MHTSFSPTLFLTLSCKSMFFRFRFVCRRALTHFDMNSSAAFKLCWSFLMSTWTPLCTRPFTRDWKRLNECVKGRLGENERGRENTLLIWTRRLISRFRLAPCHARCSLMYAALSTWCCVKCMSEAFLNVGTLAADWTHALDCPNLCVFFYFHKELHVITSLSCRCWCMLLMLRLA